MNIEIHRKNHNFLLGENRLRWDLSNQMNLVFINSFGILGLMILIYLKFDKTEDLDFWGPISSIGLAFIFLFLLYRFQSFRGKAKFLNETKKIIRRLNEDGGDVEISIDENRIVYMDSERKLEFKWKFFTGYKFYKDNLFIIKQNSLLTGIVINKNEISPEEFNELLDFIKGKLTPVY